jgi:predicted nucleic acid-binding protein
MIYFDVAYIVKCFLHEPGSSAVRQLLEKHDQAACCVFGRLEFTAAIKRAIREGRLNPRALDTVFAILEHDDAGAVWKRLPLTPHVLQIATEHVARLPENVFIRAGDALHLACARENEIEVIHSNDRHLLRAAASFGVKAANVIS